MCINASVFAGCHIDARREREVYIVLREETEGNVCIRQVPLQHVEWLESWLDANNVVVYR